MPAGIASVIMQMQVFFTFLLGMIVLAERPC
jgi:drug/metabolite transporter (DMT)-like permease